jgi:hypothetical protein
MHGLAGKALGQELHALFPTVTASDVASALNPLEWSRETWRKIAYGALITGAVVFSLGVVGLAGPAAIATMTRRVVVFFGGSAEAVGLEAGIVTVSVGAQLAGPAIATGGAAILVVDSLIDEWWRRP